MTHHYDNTTITGTIGGTLLTIIATINFEDLAKTVILAIIGATVSFFVSLFWKWIKLKINKKSIKRKHVNINRSKK